MQIYFIWLFSVICFFTPIFAGTIDPSTPDQKYIEYGKKFNYIVELCGSYNDKTLFCASAVIIEPKVIITAAHVVQNYKDCVVKLDNKIYDIELMVWPKDFNEDTFGMNDIAVGFLKNSITLDFYPSLYDKQDELNKVCCISGFGLTGNFTTGAIKSDLKRRAGSNIVEEIQKELLICRPSKTNENNRTSLEFLIASGDIGGGLFINGKLAGINSCVMAVGKTVKSDYKTESGHTRVSVHRQWIIDTIKKYRSQGLTHTP